MPKTQHRHFEDVDNEDNTAGMLKTVATELQNIDSQPSSGLIGKGRAAVNGSTSDASDDDDDDDDAAPEAIQASSAKSIERERLSKLQRWAATLGYGLDYRPNVH